MKRPNGHLKEHYSCQGSNEENGTIDDKPPCPTTGRISSSHDSTITGIRRGARALLRRTIIWHVRANTKRGEDKGCGCWIGSRSCIGIACCCSVGITCWCTSVGIACWCAGVWIACWCATGISIPDGDSIALSIPVSIE